MKDNFDNINHDLLVKFLTGESSTLENRLVENWLNEDLSNRKYFEHIRIIWEQSRKLSSNGAVNENTAWQRFQQRTHPAQQGYRKPSRRAYELPFLRVAAIMLTVFAGAWLAFYWISNPSIKTLALSSKENSVTDTLNDGSVVTLNKQSLLRYPEKFTGGSRSVRLQGEAFFTISPDRNKPFIILVNDVSIKVIGTSFNVKSAGSYTEIIVETGVVEVSRGSHFIRVLPKQRALVSKTDTSMVSVPVTDKLYNYYRTREFTCEATPLWKLVEVLNQAYNANIIIQRKELRTLPLTTVFQNKPLDSILVVIKETFNLSVVKSGDAITIQ